MKNLTVSIVFIVLLFGCIPTKTDTYYYEGKIISAQTNKPIPDTVVILELWKSWRGPKNDLERVYVFYSNDRGEFKIEVNNIPRIEESSSKYSPSEGETIRVIIIASEHKPKWFIYHPPYTENLKKAIEEMREIKLEQVNNDADEWYKTIVRKEELIRSAVYAKESPLTIEERKKIQLLIFDEREKLYTKFPEILDKPEYQFQIEDKPRREEIYKDIIDNIPNQIRSWAIGLSTAAIGTDETSTVESADISDVNILLEELKKDQTKTLQKIQNSGKIKQRIWEIAKDRNADEKNRIKCLMVLGEIKYEKCRKDIESWLINEESEIIKETVAIVLGKFGNRESIDTLQKALKNNSTRVKLRIYQALAKLGEKSGKEFALMCLKEGEPDVQLLAVDTLETFGDKNIIPILQENLRDEKVTVRWYSKVGIKKLEMSDLSEIEKIDYLEKILNSDEMNNWAAIELIKIGTDRAIEVLKKTANDPNKPGYIAAKKVIEKMFGE